MYKRSQVKFDEIIRLYKEGVGITEICKLTASSQPTVKNVLSHHGIDYNLEESRKYTFKLNQVLEMYQRGESQLTIEKTLGLTRKTIRTYLKARGVDYRDKSDQQHIRCGTRLDHNSFDQLNAQSLYWIGLLHADGHICKDREYSVCLDLHPDDKDHLEKYRKFLGSSREVVSGHNTVRMRINSKRIHERLIQLGFSHDKSYTAKPHDLLKDSRDFWRGCIDGDGGVYNYSYTKQITLCGTLETIFDFILFCSKHAGIKEKYPSKASGKVLYQVHYYGEDAQKIGDLLYKDATVYLDKKYQTYLEWTRMKNVSQFNITNQQQV